MAIVPGALVQRILKELDHGGAPDQIRTRLESLAKTLDTEIAVEDSRSRQPMRGRSFYDQLISDILTAVRSAASRESLINLAMERLTAGGPERVADGYVLIEGRIRSDRHELAEAYVAKGAGFNASRFANFMRAAGETRFMESPLAADLLVSQHVVDFLPTESVRPFLYDGELDELFDRRRGAWIVGIPLPGLDQRRPHRALIGLFPVVGSVEQPALPRGATQELRVLEFLRVGYELLNHQLESAAEQARAQRRELIADLAPGIVNHEINQQVRILGDSTDVINLQLRLLPEDVISDAAMVHIVDALKLQYSSLTRLSLIADAFNNLEKRESGSPVRLVELILEALSLVHYRCTRAGLRVDIEDLDTSILLQTDAALVEHVIINVLMNAVDAFEERTPLKPRDEGESGKLIAVKARALRDGMVEISISNNGPPIPPSFNDRIFDKGVSSKPRGIGHGLGLYICRLVMTFLGGSITVSSHDELHPGMSVIFQILLPGASPSGQALSSETSEEDAVATALRILGRKR